MAWPKSPENRRPLWLGLFFLTVCLIFGARLVNLQLTDADGTYTFGERQIITERRVTVKAARGMICDRNGTPLVSDRQLYDLIVDFTTLPEHTEEQAAILLSVLRDMEACGAAPASALLSAVLSDESLEAPENSGAAEVCQSLGLSENADMPTIRKALTAEFEKEFGAAENEMLQNADAVEKAAVALIQCEWKLHPPSEKQPHILAEDVPLTLLTRVREGTHAGLTFQARTIRTYHYDGYASHILGRVGKIQTDDVEYYTSLGYPVDATVGLDGIEKIYEKTLRGTDGVLLLREDQYGNLVEQVTEVEAEAGKNIWLTLDIDLQIAAEDGLKANIQQIVETALTTEGDKDGEDAHAGAVCVADPRNGEILAMASYPSYRLSTFTADYSDHLNNESKPLVNRALMGTYAPGSTFKVGVAAAALTEGTIKGDTLIEDLGIYTYYPDYQPRCWVYTRTGQTHGKLNVVGALRDSCNYFFFETGRLLGIEKMNSYMKQLGLGEPTGIELPEVAGILAGPAYSESVGRIWSPGDTLQAAIGQLDNAFTPAQLTAYLSAIVNGGTRYGLHLYLKTAEFYTETVLDEQEASVLSSVTLSAEHHALLKDAMREVAENGSAARIFRGYQVSVGCKTGTAQTGGDGSDNAVFAAFAPFENPELLAVSIVEHGSSGTNAGFCVRDIFDCYFSEE